MGRFFWRLRVPLILISRPYGWSLLDAWTYAGDLACDYYDDSDDRFSPAVTVAEDASYWAG